jgi:hypothetical protein
MHHVTESLRPPEHAVLSYWVAVPEVLIAELLAERKGSDKRIIFVHDRFNPVSSC